jgi:hypothetical protein
MNAIRRRSNETGQIVLIVAFAAVVLIGIAAIVIDLGFSWMLLRHEQNAADPASVAAARFISDPDPVTGIQTFDWVQGPAAACHYARANGFFSPGNITCDASLETDGTKMVIHYPPDRSAGDFRGQPGMVQVIISAEHDSFFGLIFGQPKASVKTQAVAARQRGNTSTNSMVALKPTGCDTARVRGNSTIKIYPAPGYTGPGGYVQINSDCGSNTADDRCSTSSTGALNINGTASLTAPKVNVYGGCTGKNGQPLPSGSLNEAGPDIGDPLSTLAFPPWNTSIDGASCGVGAAHTTAVGSKGCGQGGGRIPWKKSPNANCPGMSPSFDCIELDPGIYYGGWDIGSKIHVKLKPGIYVIAGGGISIGSTGSLDSIAAGGAPAPVLIYNTDNPVWATNCPGAGATKCQNNLDLTAQATLKLAGLLANQPCPPVSTTGGCPYGGMVIWYDGSASQGDNASGLVSIAGGVAMDISGTIYAPRAHVDMAGNGTMNCLSNPTQVAAVQIISWTWDLGGTGDICMPYDPNKLYKLPAQGLVH